VSSTLITVCSAFLAIAWMIVMGAMQWMAVSNVLFVSQISLFSVMLQQGWPMEKLLGVCRALSDSCTVIKTGLDELALFNQNIWLGQAATSYCSPVLEVSLGWCGEWKQIRGTSVAMASFGGVAAIALLTGAIAMRYYSAWRATAIGRKLLLICFVVAPCSGLIGMLQYTYFTQTVGDYEYMTALLRNALVLAGASSSFSTGYVACWLLSVISCLPGCIMAFAWHRASNEVEGGEEELEAGEDWGTASTADLTAGIPREILPPPQQEQPMQPARSALKKQRAQPEEQQMTQVMSRQQQMMTEQMSQPAPRRQLQQQDHELQYGEGLGDSGGAARHQQQTYASNYVQGYQPAYGVTGGYEGWNSNGFSGGHSNGYSAGYSTGYTGGFVQQPMQPAMSVQSMHHVQQPQMPMSLAFRRRAEFGEVQGRMGPGPQVLDSSNIGPMVPLVPGGSRPPTGSGSRPGTGRPAF